MLQLRRHFLQLSKPCTLSNNYAYNTRSATGLIEIMLYAESHQLSLDAMILDEDKANSGESSVDLGSLGTASKICAREHARKIHHRNLGLRHTILASIDIDDHYLIA